MQKYETESMFLESLMGQTSLKKKGTVTGKSIHTPQIINEQVVTENVIKPKRNIQVEISMLKNKLSLEERNVTSTNDISLLLEKLENVLNRQ